MIQTEKKPLYITIEILTMIAALFAVAITFIDQIYSQTQGFFYSCVFIFILTLVYMLLNLFTKLIATSAKKQENNFWKITSIVLMGLFVFLFLFFRLRLTNTVEATDSTIYKSAVSMMDSVYSQNSDLVSVQLNNPTQYIYSLFLSVVFRIFGESTKAFIVTNSVFYMVCVLLSYRITKRFSDNLCALVVALISVIIPCQTFVVYSYDTCPPMAVILLLLIDCLTSFFAGFNSSNNYLIDSSGEDFTGGRFFNKITYTICIGVLFGLLIFVEPVSIIMIVMLLIYSVYRNKDMALNILIAFAIGIVLFALLSFAKSVHSGEDYGTVLAGYGKNFNIFANSKNSSNDSFADVYNDFKNDISVQENNISNNYYYLVDSNNEDAYTDINASWLIIANQLIYMFMLVLCVSCSLIRLWKKYYNGVSMSVFLFGTVLMQLFAHNRDIQKYPYIAILIIISGISIHYIYINHHPEQQLNINTLDVLEKTGRTNNTSSSAESMASVSATMSDYEFVKRAKALIFVGDDDELYKQIKAEEHKNSMRRDGKLSALEETYDDYDEDFFLDKEDDAPEKEGNSNETVIIPGALGESNASSSASAPAIPAWKMKPEHVGSDDMFFDEEDELPQKRIPEIKGLTTEDVDPVVQVVSRNTSYTNPDDSYDQDGLSSEYDESSIDDEIDVIPTKKSLFGKAKKQKGKDKSKESDNSVKADKKAKKERTVEAPKAINTTHNGVAVRRVKNVGSSADDAVAQYLASKASAIPDGEPLPNPLPEPKKKAHKKVDFDHDIPTKKVESSGLDYDYDFDDDSDWDV